MLVCRFPALIQERQQKKEKQNKGGENKTNPDEKMQQNSATMKIFLVKYEKMLSQLHLETG